MIPVRMDLIIKSLLQHDQFKKMVLDINTELMLGSSEKNTEQTNENSKKYLRRVTALRKINKGEVFQLEEYRCVKSKSVVR